MIQPLLPALPSRVAPVVRLCFVALSSLVLALATRADAQPVKNTPTPTRLRPVVVALDAGWTSKIPPTGRVNLPDSVTVAHPGQRLAFALVAEGDERDALLSRVHGLIRVRVRPDGEERSFAVRPAMVRPIKAHGADFALLALTSGGLASEEIAKMEAGTSLVSLAVLAPDWAVPDAASASEIEVSVDLTLENPGAIAPLHLPIKRVADWLKESPPTMEAMGKDMTRHRSNLAPGQLMLWLQAVAKTRAIQAPSVYGYFVAHFQTNPLARAAALEAYPALDPAAQGALLWTLKLAGQDLAQLFPTLPREMVARYAPIAPLADPRVMPPFRDPVDLAVVKQLGDPMDLCWSGWTATGDRSYLHALVDLLAYPHDFPVMQKWQQSRGGEKGLNARVAQGLRYQIAGWSIGSFQRSDPLVADWLRFWRDDPTVAEVIRREITSLPANPAFRRKGT